MRLLIAPMAGLLLSAPALAQPDKNMPEKVRFETVDQVELRGNYWPSGRGRNSPTVLLLHRFGGKRSEDGWDNLGKTLKDAGFAVLSFDFRGHGDSTSVEPGFWTHSFNQQGIRGYRPGTRADKISFNDFHPAYASALINDIAAARLYLERRNDNSECNASNLILVGAEEGASLGMLWLMSESKRYRERPRDPLRPAQINLAEKPETKDIIGCVWLNMSRRIGPNRAVFPNALTTWLDHMGQDHKIPMCFFYGKEDRNAAADAELFIKKIRPRYVRGKPLDDGFEATREEGVPGSKLVGAKLLAPALKADQAIKKYLTDVVVEKFGNQPWEKRDIDEASFAWSARGGTFPILAKPPKDRHLRPIPVTQLGLLR